METKTIDMTEVEIIEIDKNIVTDICAQYCIENRQEVYFLAYQTNPTRPISVLWADMHFLRKNFGINILTGVRPLDINAIITDESLNHSRRARIAQIDRALKLDVRVEHLEYFNDDDTVKTHRELNLDGKYNEYGTGIYVDVPYKPAPMTKSYREYVLRDKANGLYVICKYV